MGLSLLTWGGRITDGTSTSSAQVEIWSNSLALVLTDDSVITSQFAAVRSLVATFFVSANAKISNTVTMDWIKWNVYNLATGKQVTTPTNEHLYTPAMRGGSAAANQVPISSAYRISLDDNSRNPKAKGGFFVPRPNISIGNNGRYNNAELNQALIEAGIMIDGLEIPGRRVSVWSRKSFSATPSTRLRIGDVPDNISRRRNALRENYLSTLIV